MSNILQAILLFIAALLAGALNSVAGGGSFITFPTLIFTGVPSIPANQTNTVALWPGSLASVGAYRAELTRQRGVLIPLTLVSLVGGYLGARLLLGTSSVTFNHLIPFLLLFATLVFAFSAPIQHWVKSRSKTEQTGPTPITIAGVAVLQFIVATYGGFFGAGIGILMLASLSLMGMEDIHAMNALKTVLATCINGIALITFVTTGQVYWGQVLVMVVGAILGGYYGAVYAKKVNPIWVRRFVILVGAVLTVYFFIQQH